MKPAKESGADLSPAEPGEEPFAIKDCALLAIATGERAQNLREIHHRLNEIGTDSIYYHFWGGRLRPRFEEPEFNNDFAAWARHGLHDYVLAERLSMVDPTDHSSLEDLRREVLDILEERMDEIEYVPWAKADQQFYFLRSQIVVFDTHLSLQQPADLVEALQTMSLSSIFYHFIDARRRTEGRYDDFRAWLSGFGNGYEPLIAELGAIDPFFSQLHEIRMSLCEVVEAYFAENGGAA